MSGVCNENLDKDYKFFENGLTPKELQQHRSKISELTYTKVKDCPKYQPIFSGVNSQMNNIASLVIDKSKGSGEDLLFLHLKSSENDRQLFALYSKIMGISDGELKNDEDIKNVVKLFLAARKLDKNVFIWDEAKRNELLKSLGIKHFGESTQPDKKVDPKNGPSVVEQAIKTIESVSIDKIFSNDPDGIGLVDIKSEQVELDLTDGLSEKEYWANKDKIKKLNTTDLIKDDRIFLSLKPVIEKIFSDNENNREKVNDIVKNNEYLCAIFQIYGKMIGIAGIEHKKNKLVKINNLGAITPVYNKSITCSRSYDTDVTIKFLINYKGAEIDNEITNNKLKESNKESTDLSDPIFKLELKGSYKEILDKVNSYYEKCRMNERGITLEDFKSLIIVESLFNPHKQSNTGSAGIMQITNDPVEDMIEKLGNGDIDMDDESFYHRDFILENIFKDKGLFKDQFDNINEEYNKYKQISNKYYSIKDDLTNLGQENQLITANLNIINKKISEISKLLSKKGITQEEKDKLMLDLSEQKINKVVTEQKLKEIDLTIKQLEKDKSLLSKERAQFILKVSKGLSQFLIKQNQFPVNGNLVIGTAYLDNLIKVSRKYKKEGFDVIKSNSDGLYKSVNHFIANKQLQGPDGNGKSFPVNESGFVVDKDKFQQMIDDLTDEKSDKNHIKERFLAIRAYNGESNRYPIKFKDNGKEKTIKEPMNHRNVYALMILYISTYMKEYLPK